MPISVGIAALLAVVATSYRQTIHAYPSGGGAYIVAKENLGTTPGLIAGASLLVDYVLTVSVSIAAGVAAITSAVQGSRFAWLDEHRVALCLVFIVFIALANLRRVRESGALFAAPTYLFLFSFLFMIGFGLNHYVGVARQLSTEGLGRLREIRNTVIVRISGIHRGAINALQYAKSISPGGVRAVYVDFDEEATASLRRKWEQWGSGVELVVLPSPYRELTRPLLRYVERLRRKNGEDFVAVVLPEFIPARWWQQLLHNQSSLLLKGALLFKRGVIVTSVPYHLEH